MGTRVLTINTLRQYQAQFPDAADALQDWHNAVKRSSFDTREDVPAAFPKVSFVSPDYLVFNICGGSYRLITTIVYPARLVFLKEFMTHQLYDAWRPDTQRIRQIAHKKAVGKRAAKRQPKKN